jgi:hypothetical protein
MYQRDPRSHGEVSGCRRARIHRGDQQLAGLVDVNAAIRDG